MTRLASRLARVEGDLRRRQPRPQTFAVYWDDDLVPCTEHPRCDVEPKTGRHHAGVNHLSFSERGPR